MATGEEGGMATGEVGGMATGEEEGMPTGEEGRLWHPQHWAHWGKPTTGGQNVSHTGRWQQGGYQVAIMCHEGGQSG